MAQLANIRHERFTRLWIKTGVAARAYLKAGYTPKTRSGLDAAASKLTRHDKVVARARELRRQMAARNRITVDSLVDELDEARALAERVDQPSAMISATVTKAKLVGLMVDRKEVGEPGAFSESDSAVLARVRAELGDDAASALAKALEQAPDDAAPPAEEQADAPLPPASVEGTDTLN